ncbi:MAG: hypothetical protein HRT88_06300 [Lentisphaeraceae bacterium]|nr:hypothetical protein [Lentisphaeraceae bacterium]
MRVTDWERLDENGESRRLDVEEALNAIKFNDRSLPLVRADERAITANKKRELVRPNKYIKVEELKIVGEFFSNTSSKGFHLLSAVDSDFTVKCQAGEFIVKKGQTCLLPAKLGSYGICPEPGEAYTIMRSQLGL